MLNPVRVFLKYLPSFILAFALAVAVWISAVTAADPNEEKIYPRQLKGGVNRAGFEPGDHQERYLSC